MEIASIVESAKKRLTRLIRINTAARILAPALGVLSLVVLLLCPGLTGVIKFSLAGLFLLLISFCFRLVKQRKKIPSSADVALLLDQKLKTDERLSALCALDSSDPRHHLIKKQLEQKKSPWMS